MKKSQFRCSCCNEMVNGPCHYVSYTRRENPKVGVCTSCKAKLTRCACTPLAMSKLRPFVIITIVCYPCTFSFPVAADWLPAFHGSCDIRNSLLLRAMKKLKIPSPYHDYTDYVVELVRETKAGEEWILGS